MGWPMNHFTTVLNERNGPPIRYWRVGTRLGGGEGEFIWPAMRDGGYAAIGWPDLGDLSSIAAGDQVKDAVRHLLEERYPGDPRNLGRKAGEIRDFVVRMQDGDVVVAADGERVLGIGHATGPYRFEETDPVGAPHRRTVKWSSSEEWKPPTSSEGLRTTFFRWANIRTTSSK
jgi:5-methylcytosine-specific restriction protein B